LVVQKLTFRRCSSHYQSRNSGGRTLQSLAVTTKSNVTNANILCLVRFGSVSAGTNLCSFWFGPGTAAAGPYNRYFSFYLCATFANVLCLSIVTIMSYLYL